MSLGTGIFLSSILLALVLLYVTTKDRWGWRRFAKRIGVFVLLLVVIAVLVGGGFYLWSNLPVGQQAHYAGLEIGNSPEEVMYRKGSPPTVFGELNNETGFEGWQRLIDTTKLEKGKTIQDYGEWSYSLPSGRIDVTFSTDKTAVIAIQCFSSDRLSRCPTLAGITDGDREEEVVRIFGAPDSSRISGVTKTLAYRKIGVSFTLEQQKVYMLGINDLKWVKQ
jgi:hypothetical protein